MSHARMLEEWIPLSNGAGVSVTVEYRYGYQWEAVVLGADGTTLERNAGTVLSAFLSREVIAKRRARRAARRMVRRWT